MQPELDFDTLPKSLKSKRTGREKVPCSKLVDLFQCKTCGQILELNPEATCWVCPAGFHSRAIPRAVMVARLTRRMRKLGYERWTPEGIYRIQRRVARWKWRRKKRTIVTPEREGALLWDGKPG